MNPEVQRLFEAAADLRKDQQEAFVESQTLDPQVRREVLSLLLHDGLAEALFEGAIQREASTLVSSLDWNAGRQIGRYRIMSLLGRGGMGAVYLAERADGLFEQRVALKLVDSHNPGFLLDRFHQERRILAQLNHPGIAALFDGGRTDDGSPYFVMEYVDGEAIDSYCANQKLDLRQKVELFLKVCDAIHYAHQNLIVHRDVKPANILVTKDGQPKLVDFGIAKTLEADPARSTHSSTGLLTPEFASPEQIRGDPITPASDVYSLGAVLYRLLTGRSPHPVGELSPLKAARTVAEAEVAPIAGAPADLNAIVQKSLHKDPSRRYDSAREFAEDLKRFLGGRAVSAKPDSWAYRAGKFIRRYKVPEAVLATALVMFGSGLAALHWQTLSQAQRSDPGAGQSSAPLSIAVLPLRTLGGERDQVLELGLADTLIGRLSQLSGLQVRSIEAVKQYAGADQDPREVGKALQVDAVLEGTMHEIGGIRRINFRLVSVRDGKARWSQTFDQKGGELLNLEDSIATAAVSALALTLTPADNRSVTLRPTQDEEAYRLYMEGRFYFARRDSTAFEKAIARFEGAVRRDPNFAEAHAALAETQIVRYDDSGDREYVIQQVREHAARAIQIKPSLACPWRVLAVLAENYDYDRHRTEQLYRKAIELDPNEASSHHYYGEFLALTGRFQEAEREMQIAYRLDPVSLILQTDWARVTWWGRRPELAERRIDQVLEADPRFRRALDTLFALRAARHDVSGARHALRQIQQSGYRAHPLQVAALAGIEGRKRDFDRLLAAARRSPDINNFGAMGEAYVLALGERKNEAIRAIKEVLEKHQGAGGIGLEVEPLWDNLRDEPEFQALLIRMGGIEPPEVRQQRKTDMLKAGSRRSSTPSNF